MAACSFFLLFPSANKNAEVYQAEPIARLRGLFKTHLFILEINVENGGRQEVLGLFKGRTVLLLERCLHVWTCLERAGGGNECG